MVQCTRTPWPVSYTHLDVYKRQSLGFELDGDEIHVPSWRADVEHYSDIAEEVARFYGYNRIPSTLSAGVNPRRGFSPVQKAENTIGALCRCV